MENYVQTFSSTGNPENYIQLVNSTGNPQDTYRITWIESSEDLKLPNCKICKKEIALCKIMENGKLAAFVFECHGDVRRIDASLKRFGGELNATKRHVYKHYEWLFGEEKTYIQLKETEKVFEASAEQELKDWLE